MASGTVDSDGQKPCFPEMASMFYIRVDTGGYVSDVSTAASFTLRPASTSSIVGEPFVDTWVTEEDRAKVRSHLEETLRSEDKKPKIAEAVLSLPTGPWKAILFTAASYGEEGSVDGLVIVAQDCDELESFLSVRLEVESLRKETVQARQETVQARQEADEARQEIKDLKSEQSRLRSQLDQEIGASFGRIGQPSIRLKEKVTHDLRSPLDGIVGLANTLRADDSQMNKDLDIIRGCAQRALDNVIDLVDFFYLAEGPPSARFEHLRSETEAHEFVVVAGEVMERAGKAVDKQGKLLKKHNVELITDLDGLQVTFSWDHRSVSQMLYHLVCNGLKYTTKGHVRVTIRDDQQRQGICCTVEDTGIGIPPRSMQRLFEPFQQEDNSPSREYDGLGLGLAIVYRVVNRYAGTVKIESNQGQGTCISVWLPRTPCRSANHKVVHIANAQELSSPSAGYPGILSATDFQPVPRVYSKSVSAGTVQLAPVTEVPDKTPVVQTDTARVAQSDAAASQAAASSRPDAEAHSVMSVAADGTISEEVRMALEPCGFRVICCKSGVECLQLLNQEPPIKPDIILLDPDMPGVNGFDVLQIQRRKHGAELPIIMFSAHNQVHSVVKGFELGANDWIHTPFEKEVLVARIRAHLRTRDALLTHRETQEK